MTDWFGAISAFSENVCVHQDGEVRHGRAFIQPLNPTAPERALSPAPAGIRDERRYLIIAWPGAFVRDGHRAVVVCGGRTYRLLRCELMGGGSHWEGIMRLEKGECDDAGDA